MMAMPEYTLSDFAAVTRGGGGNNSDGFGNGNSAWWLLVLFALLGGFGNNGNRGGGGYGYGAGNVGGNEIYPWLNQAQLTNDGFRDQMINSSIMGVQQGVNNLSTQICNGFGDTQMALANGFAGVNMGMANGFAGVQQSLCNGFNGVNVGMLQGFNGVEQAANMRQVADMQTQFGIQTAMMQGFNAMQAQQADCCCENRLAMANQTATILAEHCSDRAALSDGVRDIIAAQTAGTQRIIDQLCQDKIDAKNEEIAALRTQVQMQNLAASQTAQTAQLLADNARQTTMLEQYLNPVPIPAYQVANPNCCQQQCGYAA